MRKLSHQTLGAQKHAVAEDAFWEFKPGERVIADGIAGTVKSVESSFAGSNEAYIVELDNGLGGGEYTASQLTRPETTTASLTDTTAFSEPFEPVEATSVSLASHWYPELGTILTDRLPNERIQRTASLQSTASKEYPYGHVNGVEITDHEYPGESGIIRCDNCDKYHSATYDHDGQFGQGRIHAVVCPKDNLTDYYTDEALKQRPKYPARGSVKPFTFGSVTAASSSNDLSNGPVDDQGAAVPDVCSFCGNPGPWTDEQDTGRGTRIRCATCGGTMRLNNDPEAGTSGIQWAPEFPNSPENAASRAGDPRATIRQFEIVSSKLNATASIEAGYTIFHAPKLSALVETLLSVTAASLNGIADEDFVFQMTATWADVRAKAKRIRDEGGVRILAAQSSTLVGEVQGEHSLYESQINFVPGSRKVAFWTCGCKWGAYAWGRSPAYRRFEGRQCSHVLALQYEAQSRGMFGREVTPDVDRMAEQYQRTPVQVQHQRGTERAPEKEIRRRSVPPGNMRRTFSSVHESKFPFGHNAHPYYNYGLEDGAEYAKHIDRPDPEISHEAISRLGDVFHTDPKGAGEYINGFYHGHNDIFGIPRSEKMNWMGRTAYQYQDVPPTHEWARLLTSLGNPPSRVLEVLKALGVPHQSARTAIAWATTSAAANEVEHDGIVYVASFIEGDQILTADGTVLPVSEVTLRTVAVTADEDGDQDGASPVPGQYTRDQTKRKRKKHHLTHHTNDAREHAPNFGYGLPWGGHYMWCDQCGGSGCGHCGGTGQVTTGDGLPQNPSDLSSTESPVANESVDSGTEVGDDGGGMSATGALRDQSSCPHDQGFNLHGQCKACGYTPPTESDEPCDNPWCVHNEPEHTKGEHIDPPHLDPGHSDYQSAERSIEDAIGHHPDAWLFDHQHTDPSHYSSLQVQADSATTDFNAGGGTGSYSTRTPHSNSSNPASTGWATSADPGGWVQPIVNSSFGRWEAGLHDASTAEAHPPVIAAASGQEPPTVAGVALKAADTGRVLMIQRSNKNEKDPARGTWEFPGGHQEDGDQTSLHTGIREWEEEVGQPFPEGGHVAHTWRSGPYQGHVVIIPSEQHVDFSQGRSKDNPDDPDCDDHEQAAWWDPDHAKKNPALREELKAANPFGDIKKASSWNYTEQDMDSAPDDGPIVHAAGTKPSRRLRPGDHVLFDSGAAMPVRAATMTLLHLDHPSGRPTIMHRAPIEGDFSNVITHEGSAVGNGLVTSPEIVGGSGLGATYDPVGVRTTAARHDICQNCGRDIHDANDIDPNVPWVHSDTGNGYCDVEGTNDAVLLAGSPLHRPEAGPVMHEAALDQDVAMLFSGTLHDEPEPALPSTDGAVEDDDVDDSQAVDNAVDDGPEEPVPGLPLGREVPWGYPESAADHPNPDVAHPTDLSMNGSPDDETGGLQGMSPMNVTSAMTEEMKVAATLNPALAGFTQTAGFRALMDDAPAQQQSQGLAAGDTPNDADIAAAARAMLQKTGMKNFTFAEQQELIAEGGGKARARNFGDLKITGTHYERIGEDDEAADDTLYLFL